MAFQCTAQHGFFFSFFSPKNSNRQIINTDWGPAIQAEWLDLFLSLKRKKKKKANNHSDFSGVLPVQFPAGLGVQSGEMKSALHWRRGEFCHQLLQICNDFSFNAGVGVCLRQGWSLRLRWADTVELEPTDTGIGEVGSFCPDFRIRSLSGLEEDELWGILEGLSSAPVLGIAVTYERNEERMYKELNLLKQLLPSGMS